MTLAAIISFMTSPIGRWLGYGAIVLSAYLAGDVRGYRLASERCEAVAAKARAEVAAIDAKAATQARKDSEAVMADLKNQKDASDAQLDALQKELEIRPVNAPCLYGTGGRPAGATAVLHHNWGRTGRSKPAGPTVLPSAVTKAPSQ